MADILKQLKLCKSYESNINRTLNTMVENVYVLCMKIGEERFL